MSPDTKTSGYLKVSVSPITVILVVAAACFILSLVAIKGSSGFAPIWYGDAIGGVGLLLVGRRYWPLLLLSSMLALIAGGAVAGIDLRLTLAFIPGGLSIMLLSALLISRAEDPFSYTVSLPAIARLWASLLAVLAAGSLLSALLLFSMASIPVSASVPKIFLGQLNGFVAILPAGLAWSAIPADDRAAFVQRLEREISGGLMFSLFVIVCGLGFTGLAMIYATWPFAWHAIVGTIVASLVSLRCLSIYVALASVLMGLMTNYELIYSFSDHREHDHLNELMLTIALTTSLSLCLGIVRRSERLLRFRAEMARDEVNRERKKFITLFNESPDAYFVVDPGNRAVIDCNRAACSMLGVDRQELLGRPITRYQPELQPDGRRTSDLISSVVAQMAPDETVRLDMVRLRHDRTEFWVAGSVSRTVYNGQPANLWSWRDITERKQIIEQLKQAREAADNASQAKGQFLSIMSHELRTPLNGIMGMFELIRKSDAGGRVHEFASRGLESSEHLLQLISEILDLSSIEAGRFTITSERFRLGTLLDDVLAVTAVKRRNGVTLSVDAGEPLRELVLMGDPLRLKQVLINLLGNALKFTERGSVTLGVSRAGGSPERPLITFSVKDTGIGLSPEQQSRLFQPFTQVDASSGRRYGGTGLGLSISQRLVSLMGGEPITVESDFGVGSRFAFRLALPLAAGAPSGPGTASNLAQEPTKRLAGYRLLLVEDDELSRLMMRLLLEGEGAAIEEAQDGVRGVERALAAIPPHDAVLMDHQMPGKDGVAATRDLRAGGYRRPIIALTASAFPADRARFLDAGATDYVTKPVKVPDLVAALQRVRDTAEKPQL